MLRYIFWVVSSFVLISPIFADESGDRALRELSARVREMGGYESDIVVEVQSTQIEGHYRINGDSYHVDMGSVEFWGEGDRRYEVSHKIEEIVVQRASLEGGDMLLNNPSAAFDLVGQGFDALVESTAERVTLRLTPKVVGETPIDVDEIIIHLDPKTLLPTKIIYEADQDRASVEFKEIKQSQTKIPKFNISKYKKYDVVDLY